MSKGERISQFVRELEGDARGDAIADHPCYRGYFRCWNAQQYYEAHDVLEHLWLQTKTEDANYFKGLIQAAGAFVHLQKNFEQPTHAKHGRRLAPSARLFALAQKNLAAYAPQRHRFDVAAFREMLSGYEDEIVASGWKKNPWSPARAPRLELG